MKKHLVLLITVLALTLSSCTRTDNGTGSSGIGDACLSHTDSDDNGRCDECSQSLLVSFDFYAVNDLHGKILDGSTHIGVDEMTSYIKAARSRDENTVILSSGDMWQGTAESSATRGAIVTDWMNELGFVSMTLGNHEFDWGENFIRENAGAADFPFLAINVFSRETDTRVEYAEASRVIERGGFTIGIIGAVGDCYSDIAPDKVGDIYFKTDSELTELVNAETERLRAEGTDIIVLSIHDGFDSEQYNGKTIPDSRLSSYLDPDITEGVDLVFEAHTHQTYVMKDSSGVYHIQGGGDNEGITHAELKLNTVTGTKRVTEAEFINDSVYEKMTDDPIDETLYAKYKETLDVAFRPLGYNSRYRSSDYMRALVARLYLERGEELFGDEYEIFLGGGFISIRSPWELDAGEVGYNDLASMFPFDNRLVLCSVRGRELLSRFVETDNSNYYVAYSGYGEELLGKIDTGATYYVIVDTYTASYAPNGLTVVEEWEEDIYARDLLAEYVENGGLE